jgi:TolA-binding protein
MGLWLLGCVLIGVTTTPAQQPADREAKQLLDNARREFKAKNYPAASSQFQNYLRRFPTHADAPTARFGLGLCHLEGNKDYAAALEQLQLLAPSKDVPEHPYVLYYLGQAQRGLGIRELDQAAGKTGDPAKHQAAARQRFEEAEQSFAAAEFVFTARAPRPDPEVKEIPPEVEWALRARCDQVELQLRLHRVKDARKNLRALEKHPLLSRSRSHRLALYYQGVVHFLLGDHLAAGRVLNQLTPFTEPVFGNHGRYLLARVHHLTDELAEAAHHYDGVLSDYETSKRNAVEALKRPESFRNDPAERMRLQALLRDPPPSHVLQSAFYHGILLYEAGRFGDAAARFTFFTKAAPRSPLFAEAQLRLGFCQVQLKAFPDAIRTLQPLADQEPRLADQALLWLGRAQTGAADPSKPATYPQALKTALETLHRAEARARELAADDAGARSRRGEILLEIGDTQALAGQFKDAAANFGQLLANQCLPGRTAEVLQRQAEALNLAGEYAASDKVCERFEQSHPDSLLLPAIVFRRAENARFLGQNEAASKRYEQLVSKFPEFEYTALARYELALMLYRQGEFEKAKDAFERIPASDRVGPLAPVSYLLADCLIRLAPVKADDALAAGRLQENLQGAIEMLEAYAGAQPSGPQTPDALLKLGHCQQRLAAVFAEPKDAVKALTAARATYERLQRQFGRDPLLPQALFERGKVLSRMRDVNRAISELQPFTDGALRQSSVAPLAALYVATLLRGQNKAEQASRVLALCRQQHEGALLKDSARAGWVPLLRYHHGVCLQEAGKLAEARSLFEEIIQQFATSPEADDTTLRAAQCLRETGLQKIAKAKQKPANKPEEQAAAAQGIDEGLQDLRTAVERLEHRAERLKEKQPDAELRARLLLEAARDCRLIAEVESDAARANWKLPAGKLGQAEPKARTLLAALIEAFPDLPLANDARLELSELLTERSDAETALKLLNDALDREPPPELTDRVRVQMGTCNLVKGDTKAALAQFDAVLRNPKSPLAAQAHYRAGEGLLRASEWAAAVKHLAVFRDQPPFRDQRDLADRALLALGQAHAQLKQLDQARHTFEALLSRFGNSPCAPEARYATGWIYQAQKNHDRAINAYSPLASSETSELAAKAQLQIGLCRLEQKRLTDAVAALQMVPDRYRYPDLSAAARLEAARARAELKQRDAAEQLLRQVLADHPRGVWAEAAQAQLKALAEGKRMQRPEALAASKLLDPDRKPAEAFPRLSQPQADRASLDDPTAEASRLAVQNTMVPQRTSPAPFVRLTVPDPFEHRHPLLLRVAPLDEPLPTAEARLPQRE